jgi:hypothetical protein
LGFSGWRVLARAATGTAHLSYLSSFGRAAWS